MEASIYITIPRTRTLTKSQWKFIYREARIQYREKLEEIRKSIYNLALYGTTTGWKDSNKIHNEFERTVGIISHLRTSQSAHIVTQSLLTLALRGFSEKITEGYTSVVFAEPMYDVTKIQTSLSERWRIQSLENFEQNAMNSSILFGEPERNEELRHTDGSLVNYESRLKKLISECSMKNNVRGR